MQLANIISSKLSQAPSGVFVHWGAFESGKTTAVRNAAELMKMTHTVFLLQGYNVGFQNPIGTFLRNELRVPVASSSVSSAFKKQQGTIIIDHADLMAKHGDYLNSLRELARDSHTSQRFNILLVFGSYERAREVLRDTSISAQLVGAPDSGRWTRDDLKALFNEQPEEVRQRWSENTDHLLEISTIAGTPAFLNFASVGDKWASENKAEMLAYEWRNAMIALRDDTDNDSFQPGRFPNRNGIYSNAWNQEWVDAVAASKKREVQEQ